MAHIEDIQIQIALETKALTQQGFSRPLILGARESLSGMIDHYGEYADLAGMKEAGFTSADPEYAMAGKIFAQNIKPDIISVAIRDESDSIQDALSATLEKSSSWYAVLIAERDKESLHEAGDWALENKRLFFGCTDDITALSERNNIREAYLLHNNPLSYPECAWVGLCIPQEPGSITWKWKSPAGVIESNYTTT